MTGMQCMHECGFVLLFLLEAPMRKALLLISSLALLGCSDQGVTPTEYVTPSFSAVENAGPSASGNAILPPELSYLNGILATTAFHARGKADGRVSGTLETLARGQDIQQAHAELDCLVVSGNEAILGGVITHLNLGPEFPWPLCVGDRIWFKVRDNGEGAGASPDEFTDWYFDWCGTFTATVCGPYPLEEFPSFIPDFIPIYAGNVQVKQ
jgi:hypothetical protein